ncbi:MAG: hypothetical protein KJ732_04900 [Candidatus Margulisbacteria bacterium]|nr:hypothetical protein [Candidatus Margulisiibacteriota bacterium]
MLILLAAGCSLTTTSSSDIFDVPILTNWTKESGIRVVNNVSTCTIRLNDGRYRMYYPGADGISSSISTDGLIFTAEAGTRVARGTGSDYDADMAKDPDIIDEGTFYRMYYTANAADGKHRVMSATSTDEGYTWIKDAGVRINYTASYDQLADVQAALKISSNNYLMVFVYDWNGPNSLKGAISTDGLSWEVKTLTGFTDNCMDPDLILDASNNIIMFFAAPRTTSGPEPMDIYKATSTDGLAWTVTGRAIQPETSEEGNIVGDPDVILLPDGSYRMYYYGGNPRVQSDILSATATSL